MDECEQIGGPFGQVVNFEVFIDALLKLGHSGGRWLEEDSRLPHDVPLLPGAINPIGGAAPLEEILHAASSKPELHPRLLTEALVDSEVVLSRDRKAVEVNTVRE
jgi:hypothetical protein